ncbi:MAG: hemolysin family protein [Candidatus Wallbacteria bacterium]
MNSELIIWLIQSISILFVLFLLSGFFSGSEGAIFSLGHLKLKKMHDLKYRTAKYISALLSDPEKLLITIIFANLFVNTLISSLATIYSIKISSLVNISEETAVLAGTLITSYLLVLLGEVTPINLAIYFAEPFAVIAALPIYFLTVVFSNVIPIVPLIKKFTRIIMPFFGIQDQHVITEKELKSAISIGEKEGMIEPHEKVMLHSIFEFGDTVTKEVMTPRVDMVCMKSDCDIKKAFKVFKESGYSRIPVYENSLDNVIGIIHAKDMLSYMTEHKDENVTVKTILRQAYFVPETKKIEALLKELQQNKVQIAIVVDEYGGTEGLITMEDILEEIVGEIMDEHDEDEKLIEKLDIYTYKVDPKIPVYEFNNFMGAEIPEELFDTLGGLLYDLLGHVPHIGEEVTFEHLHFKVIQIDGKRIKKVFVKKMPESVVSSEDGDISENE